MDVDPDQAEVRAAGGIVVRHDESGVLRVAVVHRPKHDDWSLPKGKLDGDESFEAAALREVEEEIGFRCRLGPELPPVGYHDAKGRWKVVRYWVMEPLEELGFEPSDEIDRVRWIAASDAAAVLSYPRDAELVGLAALGDGGAGT